METEPRNSSGTRSRIWYILFSAAISGGFLYYLLSTVSLQDITAVIRGISVQYVFVFLFFSLLMSLCRTWRYSLILEASGYRTSSFALFLVTLVRNFFSDLLPARLGTLVYIYLVQNRLGLPFGAAAASFGLSFIFDMLSLAFLILLAALMISSDLIPPAMILTGGGILLVISGGVLFFLPLVLKLTAGFCLRFLPVGRKYRQKIFDALTDTRQDVELVKEQGIFGKILFLSFGVRCYKYLGLYALLLALVLPLGYSVQSFPLAKVFLGLCSAELAASLPISGIAGFGAYEGAWTLVFKLFGYPEQIALLTSVSHHLLTQIYGYALGALALLLLMHPVFQDCSSRIAARTSSFNRRVWGQIAIMFLLLLASLFFLFPGQGGGSAGAFSAPTIGSAEGAGGQGLPQNVSGKFVYQRQGAVYTRRIGSDAPQLLVKRGSWPRWSPDGTQVGYLDGNNIMLISARGGKPALLATAGKARALVFAPDGGAIIFTDGSALRSVGLKGGKVTTLLEGYEMLEIDAAGAPVRIAATVRKRFGYSVYVFDLKKGTHRAVATGCSASLSPDGGLVTVNGRRHLLLHLYDWNSLDTTGAVKAPAGYKFDNQFWSNSPHWLISVAEKNGDLFMHQLPQNRAYRLTRSGGCDRPDLFITGVQP